VCQGRSAAVSWGSEDLETDLLFALLARVPCWDVAASRFEESGAHGACGEGRRVTRGGRGDRECRAGRLLPSSPSKFQLPCCLYIMELVLLWHEMSPRHWHGSLTRPGTQSQGHRHLGRSEVRCRKTAPCTGSQVMTLKQYPHSYSTIVPRIGIPPYKAKQSSERCRGHNRGDLISYKCCFII